MLQQRCLRSTVSVHGLHRLGAGARHQWARARYWPSCHQAATPTCIPGVHSVRPVPFRRPTTLVAANPTDAAGDEQLDPEWLAAFMRLVERTEDAEVKKTLLLSKAALVKNGVATALALQALTLEDLLNMRLPKGAAAGLKAAFPSPSTAQAPAGELPRPWASPVVPVPRRQVVRDEQDPNVLWLRDAITHEPVQKQFVINPVVRLARQAMRADEALKRYAMQAQQNFKDGESQTPLLVSGPVKSGKSFTAVELLPAVVHSTFEFDYSSATDATATSSSGSVIVGTAQKPPAPIFLHVNCLDIRRTAGTAGFFRGLLSKLKSAARQQGLAAATTPYDDDESCEGALDALMEFYNRLPRDRITYVTLDEAQSFFLLELPGPQAAVQQQRQRQQQQLWDEGERRQMRRSFKPLVITTPCHVATVLTGSTMACVWANFAKAPTNGLDLLNHNFTVHLPVDADPDLLCSTWQCLQQRYQELPPALRAQTLPGHVLLVWLVKTWVQSGRGPVDNTFVLSTYQSKLYYEILADFMVVAEGLAQDLPDPFPSTFST